MKGATLKAVFDTVLMMVKNKESVDEIKKYMDGSIALAKIEDIKGDLENCKACDLCNGNRVCGEGNIYSKLMLVGEGPGENEDKLGHPFVGPAGQLLDRIIAAAGWDRDDLYITNVVKCRAHDEGKNIQPNTTQIAACVSHLMQEIDMVKPKIILCLGSIAATTLIHPKFKITEEHGRWFEIRPGILAMAIYHPSYILHKGEGTPEQDKAKEEVWDDIQLVISKLEEV